MSDVGGFIVGAVSTAAGVAVAATPIPGGRFLGAALFSIGINAMASSISGRPSQEGMQNNVGSPKATVPVLYGRTRIA